MTFKQIYEKAKENNITAWRLMVATEVAEFFENKEYTLIEEEFEEICCFVYDWVLSTEATPYEVVENLFIIINANRKYQFKHIGRYWNEITEEMNGMF